MRLSKRIHAIANQIEPGETAADIGTDHGYVPMLIVREGISPGVILSDISEGSLDKARKTFAECGIEEGSVDFRLGDGLAAVKAGETDAVIIAGLGGHTIVNILDADVAKSRSFKKLVLQPRKHSGTVRYYLYTHGWDIVKDTLAPEGKFQCEIIVAVPSEVSYREAEYPESDIRWKYPEDAAADEPVLACRRIDWKINSIGEQMGNLRKSGSDESNAVLSGLSDDLIYLKELKKLVLKRAGIQ